MARISLSELKTMVQQNYAASIDYLIERGKITARARHKASHRDIAAALRIDAATHRNIQGKKRLPRLDTIQEIARLLDVEPWQFLVPGFDPKRPPALIEGGGLPREPEDPILKGMIESYGRIPPEDRVTAAHKVREVEKEAQGQMHATAPPGPSQASQPNR